MSFKILGITLGVLAGLALCSRGENLCKGDTSAEAHPDTLTRGNYSCGLIPWSWDDSQAFDGKRSIRVDWDKKKAFYLNCFKPGIDVDGQMDLRGDLCGFGNGGDIHFLILREGVLRQLSSQS